jgi:hypothetical protein
LRFFRTGAPEEAASTLLTEEYRKKLVWVDPLCRDVRAEMLRILHAAAPVKLRNGEVEKVQDALEDQELRLMIQIGNWGPLEQATYDRVWRRWYEEKDDV